MQFVDMKGFPRVLEILKSLKSFGKKDGHRSLKVPDYIFCVKNISKLLGKLLVVTVMNFVPCLERVLNLRELHQEESLNSP